MRLPNDQQRIAIVGATGSGKTNAALWQLSRRDFDRRPWIIYNFKNDELIDGIDGSIHIGVTDPIPDHAGIYIVHPHPSESELVDEQMGDIWAHENVGVYVDEGYMIALRAKNFRALLTQGRSKYIPMIILSQRPVWMDNFVFTESDFFQVFRLQNKQDRKRVEDFIPNPNPKKEHPLEQRLPEYWSYYYDVGANRLDKMRPVPDPDAILDTFDLRLSRLRRAV